MNEFVEWPDASKRSGEPHDRLKWGRLRCGLGVGMCFPEVEEGSSIGSEERSASRGMPADDSKQQGNAAADGACKEQLDCGGLVSW